MSATVCLLANTLYYLEGGGHMWVYLNWALGARALGCQVIWLEEASPSTPAHEVRNMVAALKARLELYGLAESVALGSWTSEPLPREATEGCLDLASASEAELLLNGDGGMRSYPYGDDRVNPQVLRRVRGALQRTDYRAACLYGGDPIRLPADAPYRLGRLAMGPDTDLRAELSYGGPIGW